MWPKWHENKPFALALVILIAYASVFLWFKINQTIAETRQIGKPVPYEHTIYVEGQGKATGVPDIASITVGVETRANDVATAQAENSQTMNRLIELVKAEGIATDDIRTNNYSVWQDSIYNPDTGAYEEGGDWVISNTLDIKVRDTANIPKVLKLAGDNGATNVSGPNFTIDDTSNLKDEARKEAIADAEERAIAIAEQLGVTLERVVGYSEYTPYVDPGMQPYYSASAESLKSAEAPSILPGTSDVELTVSVTYKLAE